MPGDTIDTTELRLLSNILALVLDEQPGQAVAALDAVRRRAAQSRITGGALKNLFERVSAEATDHAAITQRTARADAQRLQQELEAATVQASRFAAENAALQQSLARAERRLARYDSGEMAQRRELAGMPRPSQPQPPPRRGVGAGMLGGGAFALMALLLSYDQSPGPAIARRAPLPPPPPGWTRWLDVIRPRPLPHAQAGGAIPPSGFARAE